MKRSGTQRRQATSSVRIYPETHKRLRKIAASRGIDVSAAIDELVPRLDAKPLAAVGQCRFCKVTMVSPEKVHDLHLSLCVLYAKAPKTPA
ncbi:MAG: hypothetical protein K2Q20_05690 [Phycisphaerales bacterium]|nr:hypothetical protein [Phycisphaerales bacterium]